MRALTKIAYIPLILIIGGIGVQTITSCSGDDNDGGGGSSSSIGSSSSLTPSSSSATPSSPSTASSSSVASSSSSVDTVASNCSLNGTTVKIGEQTWMKENLNCDVSGSVCYGNDPSNCDKYGRLYDWSTAMALPASCNRDPCGWGIQSKHRGICPSGWHIPGDEEWGALIQLANPSCSLKDYCAAGNLLKATSEWNYDYGTDAYGFSALPGGNGDSDGSFYNVGSGGFWWSAKLSGGKYAYYWRIFIEYVERADISPKSSLFSVRCIQD